jgi:glycosyltransferase involved in cell wall biosynthesis
LKSDLALNWTIAQATRLKLKRASSPFQKTKKTKLSVIVPVFNEEESIGILVESLVSVLRQIGRDFEIIFVNDGSTDRSAEKLASAITSHPEVKVIEFRYNAGQTAALMAGIDHASGDVIVTIDADLQNDPEDIPLLLTKLDEGADVVSGWRKDRQDAAIRRNLVSRIANMLISRISGVRLHDYGCTLKAYRKEVLGGMRLYGEMHRFVPIYASWMGAKVVELPVRHHARRFGNSKYGLNRTLKVVLDLMVVKFFSRYLVKPIYVFGGFGIWTILAGILAISYALYLKFFESTTLIQTPLPVLAAMLILIGISSILMGLLAEIMVRTYFESQGISSYNVRKLINFDRKS